MTRPCVTTSGTTLTSLPPNSSFLSTFSPRSQQAHSHHQAFLRRALSPHTRKFRRGTCPCGGQTPASRGHWPCLSPRALPHRRRRSPRSPAHPQSRCAPPRGGRTYVLGTIMSCSMRLPRKRIGYQDSNKNFFSCVPVKMVWCVVRFSCLLLGYSQALPDPGVEVGEGGHEVVVHLTGWPLVKVFRARLAHLAHASRDEPATGTVNEGWTAVRQGISEAVA